MKAHVPSAFDEALEELEIKETAFYRLLIILVSVFLGLPLYLLTNITGRKYDGQFANHFNPYSPLFTKRERLEVIISDAALLVVICALTVYGQTYGWMWLLKVRSPPPLSALFSRDAVAEHPRFQGGLSVNRSRIHLYPSHM
jgi:hypothetical protein